MKITRFEINDFKGVKSTTISVADEIPGNVVTLIGLNESGKTTILEAISSFVTDDRDVKEIFHSTEYLPQPQDMIPKNKKSAFSGDVKITAFVTLEADDSIYLQNHFKEKHKLEIDVKKIPENISITRIFRELYTCVT